MKHKPIYLNGVDVSECVSFDKLNGQNICCYEDTREDKIPFANFCVENKDCYFKQLARKTHECEELKERLERIEEDLKYQCVDCMNVKSDRYRKALEEIEKELKEDIYCESQECGCDDFEECLNCVKTQILDIINKAKGEENVTF